MSKQDCVVMYRPVNQAELDLVSRSGYRRWPPRLPGQPIFYPVTNEEYATQITERWNVSDFGRGYVTRFKVKSEFVDQFPVHKVGGDNATEWWIPAERLEELNDNIVGLIEVIHDTGG